MSCPNDPKCPDPEVWSAIVMKNGVVGEQEMGRELPRIAPLLKVMDCARLAEAIITRTQQGDKLDSVLTLLEARHS